MIYVEFTGEMNRLSEVFGKNKYPKAMLQRVWYYSKEILIDDFKHWVTWAIDNLDLAPKVPYFRSKAQAFRFANKSEFRPTVEPITCQHCLDTCICFIKDQDGSEIFVRCDCDQENNPQVNYNKELPVYDGKYQRIDIKIEDWKPVEGMKDFNNKMLLWKEKMKISKQYWAQT